MQSLYAWMPNRSMCMSFYRTALYQRTISVRFLEVSVVHRKNPHTDVHVLRDRNLEVSVI